MSGTLECKECGKLFASITPQHLRASHDMSTTQYKLKYPGAPLLSKEMIARIKYTKKVPSMFKIPEVIEKEPVKEIEDTKTYEIKTYELVEEGNEIIEKLITEDVIAEELPIEKISLIDLGNEIVNESPQSILTKMERSPKNSILDSISKIEELDLSFTKKLDEFKTIKPETYPNPKGLIHKDKLDILNYLLTEFPNNVINNFFVEQYSEPGRLSYRYVTDIVLPDLFIDIEFPNAFWHNYDVAKQSRDAHLIRDGWKIIDVNTRMPKIEDLKKELKKHKLI